MSRGPSRLRRSLAVALSTAVVVAGSVTGAHAVVASVPAAPNPTLPAQCAMDLAISIDLSNSVAPAQLDQTRAELTALAADLEGYPVRLAFHNFASNAPATGAATNAPLPLTSLDPAGIDAIAAHLAGIERPAPAAGGTNWDRAFAETTTSPEAYDALLFVTDGNPTQYGSPAQGPGSSTNLATIDAAVTSANALKAEGTRVIGIGIGDNLSGAGLVEFRENMGQVSGPVEGTDYFVADFGTLRSTLVDLVNQNCASIDLVKSAALAGGALGYAGDRVDYTFTVTNDGAIPLTDVTLADQLDGLSAVVFGAWPGPVGVLEPGQSVTASASYVLKPADAQRGHVDNVATVRGNPPAGSPVTAQDEETVTYDTTAEIDLVKTGVLAGGARGVAGDTVTYRFVVSNTGAVTLGGVTVADPLPGLSAVSFGAWPGAIGTLAPGQSVTASATYSLTQADVDAGAVDNTATASGTPPQGPAVTDEDDVTVPVAPVPGISLVKSGTLATGATGVAGDVVEFGFTATNTGSVTLRDVTLTDRLEGLSGLTYGRWPGAARVLAPGQSVTATATYTLTQADVDAGGVDNSATATGTPPQGPAVEDDDDVTVPVPPTPSIDLVKSGTLAPGAPGAAGDEVAFSFEIMNTGNVTLLDVALTDDMPGLSDVVFGAWPGASGELAPGQRVTASATYTLTQADIDAGRVDNTATATATSTTVPLVEDTAEVTVPVPQPPAPAVPGAAIDLVKTGALATGATGLVGETVEYSFTVTNSGNVTLRDVTVVDELEGLSAITFAEWPGAVGMLAPGEQVRARATYVLTQADVDAGKVDNTATATGVSPDGVVVEDVDTARVSTTALAQTGLSSTMVGILGAAVLMIALGGAAIVTRRRLT